MTEQGIKYVRTPQGSHEEWLVRIGWKMVGLNLWEYPNSFEFRLYYTTDQAIAISEEKGLDLYCPACGSCGTDGCCSPDRCKCLHRDQHNKDYETLLRENEEYYNFIKKVSITPDVDLDMLPCEADNLLHGEIPLYGDHDRYPNDGMTTKLGEHPLK